MWLVSHGRFVDRNGNLNPLCGLVHKRNLCNMGEKVFLITRLYFDHGYLYRKIILWYEICIGLLGGIEFQYKVNNTVSFLFVEATAQKITTPE